jgi:hypothetical protein
MRFARWVFLIAGIYGIAVVFPQYFLEAKVGRDYPPAITHPEYFYSFVGVGLAWQVAFLIIARDPARFRPIMLTGIMEKLLFAFPVHLLAHHGLAPSILNLFAAIDVLFAALFAMAYWSVGADSGRAERPGQAAR